MSELKSLSNGHWALEAIGQSRLAEASRIVNETLAMRSLGKQIAFDYVHDENQIELLERVAVAYELMAIDGLDELSRPEGSNRELRVQTVSACSSAFEIRRLQELPDDDLQRILAVLQLCATAYCGDRWTDLSRWFNENSDSLSTALGSGDSAGWDKRLLIQLFDCWIGIFRKNGWDDLNRVGGYVSILRSEQGIYESSLLEGNAGPQARSLALRLAALYHWAKASEIIAIYILEGQPASPFPELDKHMEAAYTAAAVSGDNQLEMIIRWLHAAARVMITNSLWFATRAVSSKTSEFVRNLTTRSAQSMFELLPPQRTALAEQGLLDQAKTAIVIDLPTSGGKTLLAEFRILQALNQFGEERGWVAYVAPTRALTAQISRRLRKDFEPVGIRIEQLSSAIELDSFEEKILSDESAFDVLVTTPEKLSLIIRNQKVSRPLALVVMDEAHNIENEGRGLRTELLLATVKRDYSQANFLLLMPFVPDTAAIAGWLAQDANAGQSISLGTTPWKPNERVVGVFRAEADNSEPAGWHLKFTILTDTQRSMAIRGTHQVGGVKPLDFAKSRVLIKDKQKSQGLQCAAMAKVMSSRGTSIAVANNTNTVWSMAREVARSLDEPAELSPDIRLVQEFLSSEISREFELIELLGKRVGVHHAGLSDEVRGLMEWLVESGEIKVLCATSTIAQGINFPVSSIFLSSRFVPSGRQSEEMGTREFWNLAGRAGRLDHDTVGVVGIAEGTDPASVVEYVNQASGALVSRLVTLLEDLADKGDLANLESLLWQDQWEDFRCYVTHLWAQKKDLEAVLADTDQLLRQTLGYSVLRNNPEHRAKADALLTATQAYARKLSGMPAGMAELADSTGFSAEGVRDAIIGMGSLEQPIGENDWTPESLFGANGRIADLYGVMLKVPQLKSDLADLAGQSGDGVRLSQITSDWVNGKTVEQIAVEYFASSDGDFDLTKALSETCKAIYRTIANNGTWGVSALSRMAGLDFEKLSERQVRDLNALPAMIYHGVNSESAVLMRMNSVPRSVSTALGSLYESKFPDDTSSLSIGHAREFLKELPREEWNLIASSSGSMSGQGYKKVWEILSGEVS